MLYLKRYISIIACAVALLLVPAFIQADELHGQWSELLASHVDGGQVDYQGFKADEPKLDEYLEKLAAVQPDSLPEQDRLAYYINVYNAYTVKLILKNFKDGEPVTSIKKIGGFLSSPWSIEFVKIGTDTLTLDNIEHDIIRPKFGEPRVHFAVNCASISCPPLISEAYTAEKLEEQLEKNTIAFLNDPEFNYISENTLYLSKIFSWFGEDFDNDATSFVQKYAHGEMLEAMEAAGTELKVKYLDYNWNLNSGK